MSTFKISAETFLRLSSVVNFFEPHVGEETRRLINTIRLENKNGQSVAVVTNKKIAVIEGTGRTDHPDGVCHVNLTPELLDAAKRAEKNSLPIIFTLIPEIAVATAQIGVSEFISNVALWFDETPLDDWRSWVVPAPPQSSGIMEWDLFHVETLIRSSPSAKVLFPEFIDASKPMIIRDRFNDYWIGVFIPGAGAIPNDKVRTIEQNIIPEFAK